MSPLQEVQQKSEDVKKVLRNNIELALERDSKLENLDQHSLELLSKTKEFQKEAKSIKRQKLMQKIRLYACVLFLIVALILIFYFSIS